ncbi:hypothetical protein C4568_04700 [Candidatus Parcubacteria bacterium]|nr:MAG: hypothetical protein C4568_04700 [Candidatus Parcubacteria bacterium]
MVVLLLGSLAGWYAYLQTQKNPLEKVSDETNSEGFEGNRGGPVGAVTAGPVEGTEGVETTPEKQIERLWRVSQGPVAGFAFTTRTLPTASASSSGALLYTERANGYIFGADVENQRVTRITNTLMPKIYEAYFPDGEHVLLRSMDESGSITTFAGSFLTKDATTTPQSLTGSNWSANIRDIALDEKGKTILTLTNDAATGGSIGTTQLFDGTKRTQVFSSFIRSWEPVYGQGQLIVFTKPSDGLPGYAYRVGSSGALSLLVGPIPGLSVLPHPTENALLYSGSGEGRMALLSQVESAAAAELSLITIADKCVWAPGKTLIAYCAVPKTIPASNIMNDWYRGALHTEDSWMKIDIATGETEELFTPQQSFDVHAPTIDASGSYIAFTNGKDQSLWMLRVVQ